MLTPKPHATHGKNGVPPLPAISEEPGPIAKRVTFSNVAVLFLRDYHDGRITAKEACDTLYAAALARGLLLGLLLAMLGAACSANAAYTSAPSGTDTSTGTGLATGFDRTPDAGPPDSQALTPDTAPPDTWQPNPDTAPPDSVPPDTMAPDARSPDISPTRTHPADARIVGTDPWTYTRTETATGTVYDTSKTGGLTFVGLTTKTGTVTNTETARYVPPDTSSATDTHTSVARAGTSTWTTTNTGCRVTDPYCTDPEFCGPNPGDMCVLVYVDYTTLECSLCAGCMTQSGFSPACRQP